MKYIITELIICLCFVLFSIYNSNRLKSSNDKEVFELKQKIKSLDSVVLEKEKVINNIITIKN